uniref:Uncharacterized protein n=1 Tax=Ignavibacterium album TaxID=591197 RepID=A0A832G1F5_9BACT
MIRYFKIGGEQKSWLEITREERLFCSELYHDIRKDIIMFVKFLNNNSSLNLDENTEWEIGYEVCFYRDFLKAQGKTIKSYNKLMEVKEKDFNPYPPKRTFDLCLFSNDQIVIIEAKVDQRFSKKQLDSLDKDKKLLTHVLKERGFNINVDTILLIPSNYPKESLKGFESKRIYWDQLGDYYNNKKLYYRANILG